ncbi:Ubiquitin conjugating enzyme [Phaffia rhodozyma]|uniref:Ubiquitin conjugating enzyme n=1 Tax=Phaffia rhodozyma TaxID=264483 RepID=A0A0F7SF19_PHARH|nr:Ubiquitin conjugating enzyme [Phaffia rhodozyma]
MSSISTRRLTKELKDLTTKGAPPGINLLKADDLSSWLLTIEVPGDNLYQGETFCLKFTFGPQYPIDSPTVVFVVNGVFKAPIHPHVYSNGHICASILGDEWNPLLSAQTVCLTIQSMLASCTDKSAPKDNDRYIRRATNSPKDATFVYHDDTV